MLDRAWTRFSTLLWALPFLGLALTLCAAPADARPRHHRGGVAHAIPRSPTDPEKDAALIVDGETGKVLYSRNANAERHPASLTKMMTLYLLFEALKKGQLSLSSALPVSAHAAAQKPTKLHLYAGDSIPVDVAIYAIVVRSANDVAVTIAEALGGTEGHFAEMMNVKARQLGMRDTFYHNASGLPDPLQISTASDLAILARHLAYDFPQYFHYFSAPGFSYRGTAYVTHDNLIGRYDGADGIKTGYTGASGFNLVSSVTRGRNHIIGVVMGGRTARRRDAEMMHLLDDTFAQIAANPTLVASNKVPWQQAAQNNQTVLAGFDLTPPTTRPAQPQQVAANDGEDEDLAESRPDNDIAFDTANEIAPPPAPVPAPPPQQRPQPPAKAPVVVAMNVPIPQPKPHLPPPQKQPERPVVLASYQPPSPKPQRSPTTRPEIGEGDIGDDVATAAKRLTAQDWTIQIGAFADSNIARAQLATYAERSMDILGQAARIIVPFKGVDGQTLFRARFGPFVEREAREVCARLTERGQTCFAALATR
ncbi:MAG TPA: D-alanyl-D-alanine carboxypeptidase [Rhizomicrobium sp.]|nr:D-alanyl-D-alanine carboxypeptidase [Rhizomicrobium sp.]